MLFHNLNFSLWGDGTVTNTTPASATLHVGSINPPSINKNFSPNTILVGQTSQLTVRIRNNDLAAQLTQASITDNLPSGVVLADPVSATLSNCGASATVTANAGGSSVTLNNAVIQPNGTCTIRVNVTLVRFRYIYKYDLSGCTTNWAGSYKWFASLGQS